MVSTLTRIKKSPCWKKFDNPDDVKTCQALLAVGEVLKDRGRKKVFSANQEFHSPKLTGVQSGLRHVTTFTPDRCLYWGTGNRFDAWVISHGSEYKLEELGLQIPEGVGEIMYPTSRAIIVPGNRSMSFRGDGFRYASIGSHVIVPPTRFDTHNGATAFWSKPLHIGEQEFGDPQIIHTLAAHQYSQAGKYVPLSSTHQERWFMWDRDMFTETQTKDLLLFVHQQAAYVTQDESKDFLKHMSFAVFMNSPEIQKTFTDIHKGFIRIVSNHVGLRHISAEEVIDICSDALTRTVAYRLFAEPIKDSAS